MPEIKDGDLLPHVQAPRFLNEPADQIIGIGFQSGNEMKVSLTFGRDELNIVQETFKQIAPGAFQTVTADDGFTLTRLDLATFTMSLDAAVRLRDLLTNIISASQITPLPPTPGQ